MTLFVVTLAAAEIGLGLAIVLLVYRSRTTIAVDDLTELGETSGDVTPDRTDEVSGEVSGEVAGEVAR
jgi:NADH-quinone oxidoreductase subunit K